ncbi:MAG: hypothetical protein ACK4PH_08200 [Aquincola tertiaricarbonis]|uniref:hypothetical protein n=1 Tax=Aquincola tertiaricarbonis TaxID=391953 RepID=UPI0006153ACC|nr:hypothetical protein [Aquincola tertiaricarbonis]
MTDLTHHHTPAAAPARDSLATAGVFLAGFVVLLVFALLAQLLMLPWRGWLPGAEGEASLFGAVRAAVYTFMSHLD